MANRVSTPLTGDALADRLLAAAVDVFLEKGFAAASVDDIAARAKASKLTFYKHYGNKEGLFEAVVTRQNNALFANLQAEIPDGLTLEQSLKEMANRLYRSLLKSDTVKLVRVLHAEAERFPRLSNVFDDAGPARAIRLLSEEMQKHMAQGALRKADPLIAAEQFLHLSLGEITRRLVLGLRPPLGKTEISKRINAGIDTFLRAYAP